MDLVNSTIEVPVSSLKAGTLFSVEGHFFRLVRFSPSGALVQPLDEQCRITGERFVICSESPVIPFDSFSIYICD